VTVTKPDISEKADARLKTREQVTAGDTIRLSFTFRNRSGIALNGTQAIVTLPDGVTFDFATGGTATVQGHDVVVTLGRTVPGERMEVEITARVSGSLPRGSKLTFTGELRSSTALSVAARSGTA